MNITTIIGAWPQFIKAAMVSRSIAENNQYSEYDQIKKRIIHTGQHYDQNISEIFFHELNIAAPAVNLGVGSGHYGETTGKMLAAIDRELISYRPDRITGQMPMRL